MRTKLQLCIVYDKMLTPAFSRANISHYIGQKAGRVAYLNSAASYNFFPSLGIMFVPPSLSG
jgi:hypothetical protein